MTREELLGMWRADAAARCKMREIEHLRDLRERVTTCLRADAACASGAGDRLGDLTGAILDLENELKDDIERGIRCRREFERVVSRFASPQEYEVMHRRYVQFESFDVIAKGMHYSRSAIHKIHERALKKVEFSP